MEATEPALRAAARFPIERQLAAQLMLTAVVGGGYPMRNIAHLPMRFWQGSQAASNTQIAAMAENRDRSSMADFVRILQAYDQAH